MTEFLASYSGIFDLNSFVFVVVGLAALALTASFSKTSLTIAVDLAYPVGLLGTFIGLIGILQNMSDPEALGPAFAISLLTVLYASVIHGLASGRSREVSEVDSTFVKKIVGSVVFLGVVGWGMDSAAGLGAFVYVDVLVLFFLSVLALVIFDRVSGGTSKKGWGLRFLGIGLLGFLIGIVGMLANLDDPKALGPAMALAYISMLDALFLCCVGRIWFPDQTLDSDKNMNTGFVSLAFPILFGVVITCAILIMSFQ